jgi:hypothetical protein
MLIRHKDSEVCQYGGRASIVKTITYVCALLLSGRNRALVQGARSGRPGSSKFDALRAIRDVAARVISQNFRDVVVTKLGQRIADPLDKSVF